MRCYKCQKEIPDNSLVCSWCGAEMSVQARQRDSLGADDFAPFGASQALPMNWYKFLVFFMLFFEAVQHIFTGISYITGYISKIPLGEEGYVVFSFSLLGESFKWVDIVYGALLLFLALFALAARYQLAKFRKNAIWIYLSYLIVSGLISVGYLLSFQLVAGMEAVKIVTTITELIPQALMVYLNYIYFEKRKHLFRG